MGRYQLDPDARCDLQRIRRYIRRHNPASAERVIDGLRKRFELLSHNPDVGESVEQYGPGMRRFSAGSYVIYFRAADCLQIVRILHGAQDADSQLP